PTLCLHSFPTRRSSDLISARFAAPIPKGFTMEQAASCLVAYQTAWYALIELGRLRRGDRILIHAAAGGVGLAAVHIAQYFGAEIDRKSTRLNSSHVAIS